MRLPSDEKPSAFLTWWMSAVRVLLMMLKVGSGDSFLRLYAMSGEMIEGVEVCRV